MIMMQSHQSNGAD